MGKFFGKFSIRTKILLSLGSQLALLGAVALVVYLGSLRTETFRKASLKSEMRLEALTNFRASVRNRLLETYDAILIYDLDMSKITETENRVNVALLGLREHFSTPEDHLALADLKRAYLKIDTKLEQLVSIWKDRRSSAEILLIEIREITFNDEFLGAVTHLIDEAKLRASQDRETLKASFERNNKIVMLIAICGAMLTFLVAYALSRSIGLKVERLTHAAEQLAIGKYQTQIPIFDRDELSRVSISFNEMTAALKSAHEKLQAQQGMLVATSKMSALGEMAGGVAHEINTPLTTIQLISSQLRSSIQKGEFEAEVFRESLMGIESTVGRIAKIVSGLRSFSRDSRQDPVTPYSLRQVVEEALAMCRDRAVSQNIDIQFEATGDFVCLCRPSEISQVLVNLLNNAFDALEPLDKKWIRIDLREENGQFRLDVTDAGPGIPAEIREKLMQPFFTTKDIGRGTGLGLSISKGLVEGHGGRIFVDTSVDHTRFSLLLPKPPQDMAPPKES